MGWNPIEGIRNAGKAIGGAISSGAKWAVGAAKTAGNAIATGAKWAGKAAVSAGKGIVRAGRDITGTLSDAANSPIGQILLTAAGGALVKYAPGYGKAIGGALIAAPKALSLAHAGFAAADNLLNAQSLGEAVGAVALGARVASAAKAGGYIGGKRAAPDSGTDAAFANAKRVKM